MLRESARSILTFMCSLKTQHLSEFWSPYTAYHITSATIILLRCTIETKDPQVLEKCQRLLLDSVHWLRASKKEHCWDLGDICLAQCEEHILHVCGEQNRGDLCLQHPSRVPGSHIPPADAVNRPASSLNHGIFSSNIWGDGVYTGPSVIDTQHDVNGFEYPWADLWDSF
jgi:hypothetical protein